MSQSSNSKVGASWGQPAASSLAPPVFSPEDVAPGVVIGGKYRIEGQLGVGAMGIVLVARHLELDERVALKIIRPDMQSVPGVSTRFAREAKALVRISSEHVARVLDVGQADRIGPYIVMEHLEGQDLGELIEARGPIGLRQAAEFVLQACEGLAIAHAQGIVHRDIKPGNLFLVRKGQLDIIKVLDFGVSKAALTGQVFGDDVAAAHTQAMLGTPMYMSPEQIRATNEVDERTDIWATGAVLYELLSGKAAFFGDTVMQVCAKVLEQDIAFETDLTNIPEDAVEVVRRCLTRDADKRYQNVSELAEALMRFAPSRARVHVDRARSILGKGERLSIPASDALGTHPGGVELDSWAPPSSTSIPRSTDIASPHITENNSLTPISGKGSTAPQVHSVQPDQTFASQTRERGGSRWLLLSLASVLAGGLASTAWLMGPGSGKDQASADVSALAARRPQVPAGEQLSRRADAAAPTEDELTEDIVTSATAPAEDVATSATAGVETSATAPAEDVTAESSPKKRPRRPRTYKRKAKPNSPQKKDSPVKSPARAAIVDSEPVVKLLE